MLQVGQNMCCWYDISCLFSGHYKYGIHAGSLIPWLEPGSPIARGDSLSLSRRLSFQLIVAHCQCIQSWLDNATMIAQLHKALQPSFGDHSSVHRHGWTERLRWRCRQECSRHAACMKDKYCNSRDSRNRTRRKTNLGQDEIERRGIRPYIHWRATQLTGPGVRQAQKGGREKGDGSCFLNWKSETCWCRVAHTPITTHRGEDNAYIHTNIHRYIQGIASCL